jgi:Eukaryotic aspartyl protease
VDVDPVKWGFWGFAAGVSQVGDRRFKREQGVAIADTGTTLILTHPYIVWSVYSKFRGARYDTNQRGWVYPSGANVPKIAFAMGKDRKCMVAINNKDMAAFDFGTGYDFGAIQENPAYDSDQITFDIFGYPFLRHVYSIFDIKNSWFRVVVNEENDLMTSFPTDEQTQEGSGSPSTNAEVT